MRTIICQVTELVNVTHSVSWNEYDWKRYKEWIENIHEQQPDSRFYSELAAALEDLTFDEAIDLIENWDNDKLFKIDDMVYHLSDILRDAICEEAWDSDDVSYSESLDIDTEYFSENYSAF